MHNLYRNKMNNTFLLSQLMHFESQSISHKLSKVYQREKLF